MQSSVWSCGGVLRSTKSDDFLILVFRKNKQSMERENLEEKGEVTVRVENGIPCEVLDLKAGHINGVFAADDERFTSL